MTDDIKLPPLPDNDAIENVIYARSRRFIPQAVYDDIRHITQEHTLAAIKADRQQRGEPVATVRSVSRNGVKINWVGGFPQIGDRLYLAPQPAAPAIQYEHLLRRWMEFWQGCPGIRGARLFSDTETALSDVQHPPIPPKPARTPYGTDTMSEFGFFPECGVPEQEPSDKDGWMLGNLLTLTQDGYPALGAWFGQIWEGDVVVARVYGKDHEEVVSRANTLLARYGAAQQIVPDDPDQALLVSMATCINHGFGLLDEKKQAAMLYDMRKLWDEVMGRGYYTPSNRERYISMLAAAPKFGEEE